MPEAAAIKSSNITSVQHAVSATERTDLNGHRGGVLWLTGLSGSGKSTLGVALERYLLEKGWRAYMLDGDNVRHRLNRDLGFSHEDRTENIRRIGEVASLFADAGIIVITCFISPYRSDRQMARAAAGDCFREVYLSTSVEACESRDPKGLYKKARKGEIPEFTGISDPMKSLKPRKSNSTRPVSPLPPVRKPLASTSSITSAPHKSLTGPEDLAKQRSVVANGDPSCHLKTMSTGICIDKVHPAADGEGLGE